MKHKKWWCHVFWNRSCPCCWVRRFRYGYRLEPHAYMKDRDNLMHNSNLTVKEAMWVLEQCPPINWEL